MSETTEIAKLVTGAAMVPSILTDAWGRQHAMLPDVQGKFTRMDITPKGAILPKPAFIDQLVNINHKDSLIDYVNRFKSESTVIFADIDGQDGCVIAAVIDYHKASSDAPGLVEHQAILNLAHSEEWKEWTTHGERKYTQEAFARMLDVAKADIVGPISGASLLEKIMDFETAVNFRVNRKMALPGSNAGTGGVEKTVTQSGDLPASFTLSIPVFSGESKVNIMAQTILETSDQGKTSFTLKMARTRLTVEDEIKRICETIAVSTSVPVMMGALVETK